MSSVEWMAHQFRAEAAAIDISTVQARSPEWLRLNLDNPKWYFMAHRHRGTGPQTAYLRRLGNRLRHDCTSYDKLVATVSPEEGMRVWELCMTALAERFEELEPVLAEGLADRRAWLSMTPAELKALKRHMDRTRVDQMAFDAGLRALMHVGMRLHLTSQRGVRHEVVVEVVRRPDIGVASCGPGHLVFKASCLHLYRDNPEVFPLMDVAESLLELARS